MVYKKPSDFLPSREDTVVVISLILTRFHLRTIETVLWLQRNLLTGGFLRGKIYPIFSCLVDVLLLGF